MAQEDRSSPPRRNTANAKALAAELTIQIRNTPRSHCARELEYTLRDVTANTANVAYERPCRACQQPLAHECTLTGDSYADLAAQLIDETAHTPWYCNCASITRGRKRKAEREPPEARPVAKRRKTRRGKRARKRGKQPRPQSPPTAESAPK